MEAQWIEHYTCHQGVVGLTLGWGAPAFTALGGRKGIRPVKKLSGGVLAWLSVRRDVQMICIWST